MAQLNFDANTVAPATALDPIPAGWYTARMTASEMKPTSTGNGAYLEAEFTVMAPQEFAGRKVYDRMNLQNSNPVAVEIAYRTLSAICHAVGVIQVVDSAQLHNLPLQLKVALRPAGPGADGKMYEASNEVKGYKAVESQAQPAAAIPPVAQPQWQPPAQPAPQPAAQQWTQPAQPQAPAAQPQWTPPAQPQAPAPQPQWTPPQQPQAPQQPAPVGSGTPPWAQAQAPAPQGGSAPVPPWAQPKA